MLRTAVAIALLVVLMGVTGARQAHAGNFLLVDTTSDLELLSGCFDEVPDGDCSLRGAIILSNSIAGLKALIFNVGAGVPTIVLQSPLPAITQPVIMEGASGGANAINIYGTNVQNSAGLYLSNHSGSSIKHMVINQFNSGTGLLIRGGGNHTIVGNWIGTNYNSTQPIANSNGIFMEETTGNTIGGIGPDRNVISGNTNSGIWMDLGASGNTIAGNIIGLTADETTVMGNGMDGIISVLGASNQIGVPGSPNVIAGNGRHGVNIGGFGDNRVQSNFIGLNSQGQAKPNVGSGINVGPSEAGPIIIGGSLENGNAISGNGSSGVRIEAGAIVEVSGNVIGMNPNFGTALPNQGDGVEVVNTDTNFTTAGLTPIEIGKPGVPNIISGNTGDGIVIRGVDGVSVRGNNIGVNSDRNTGFGNGLHGINVAAADDSIIDGNFIAGHPGSGIFIDGRAGDAEGNEIQNNFIGGVPGVAGNGNGIGVTANRNDIVDNTIVDNIFDGIVIVGNGNRLSRNLIGTNSEGGEVGNGLNGVTIRGDLNLISPDATVSGQPAGGILFPFGANIIWNNGGAGVFIEEGVGNTIRQNSMRDNAGGAIDLAPEGPTPNDTDDPDSGANDRQNFPVLSLAAQRQTLQGGIHPSGGGGFLEGSLNSTPNTEFIIDVYTQDICNETANLQPAEESIGSFEVVTDSNGDVEFSQQAFSDMEPGAFVNATATHDLGSTSELSDCIQVTGTVPTPTPSPTPSPTPTSGPTATPTPTPSPTDVFGDADCDGDVDVDDFIAALSEVAGVPPGAPCENNVGCEDPIDAQDALDILKYAASPADYPLPLC